MAFGTIVYSGLPMIELFAYENKGAGRSEDTYICHEVLCFGKFIIITAYKMLFSVHYSFIRYAQHF